MDQIPDIPEIKKRGRKKKPVTEIEPKLVHKRGRKTDSEYYKKQVKQDTHTLDIPTETFILKIEKDINTLDQADPSILHKYINTNVDLPTHQDIIDLYDEQLLVREQQDTSLLATASDDQILLKENNFFNQFTPDIDTTHAPVVGDAFQLLSDHKKKWPDTTPSACHWCCHTFEGPPLGLPVKFIPTKITNIKGMCNIDPSYFQIRNIFCSFSCMLAYRPINKDLIQLLYKSMTGKTDKIKPAPPKETLCMFGGKLSIDEFRGNTKKIQLLNFPMYPIRDYIEEIDTDNIKKANVHIFNKKVNQIENKLDFLKFS